MKSIREEGIEEMNRVETIDQIFFHLGAILDSNDRPVVSMAVCRPHHRPLQATPPAL